MTEQKFLNTLLLSADTPEQLRPIDVDRVMSDAHDRGAEFLAAFRAWLLRQDLMGRTRAAVQGWEV